MIRIPMSAKGIPLKFWKYNSSFIINYSSNYLFGLRIKFITLDFKLIN